MIKKYKLSAKPGNKLLIIKTLRDEFRNLGICNLSLTESKAIVDKGEFEMHLSGEHEDRLRRELQKIDCNLCAICTTKKYKLKKVSETADPLHAAYAIREKLGMAFTDIAPITKQGQPIELEEHVAEKLNIELMRNGWCLEQIQGLCQSDKEELLKHQKEFEKTLEQEQKPQFTDLEKALVQTDATRITTDDTRMYVINYKTVDRRNVNTIAFHTYIGSILKAVIPNASFSFFETEKHLLLQLGISTSIKNNQIQTAIALSNAAEWINNKIAEHLDLIEKIANVGKDLKLYDTKK